MSRNLIEKNSKFIVGRENFSDPTEEVQDDMEPDYHIFKSNFSSSGKSDKISGVIIGKLTGFGPLKNPLVEFSYNNSDKLLPARSTVDLNKNHISREALLMFEGGDPDKPIIIGIIINQDERQEESFQKEETGKEESVNFEVDGERVIFTANKEIVLNCGKASITLTSAGKVLIRGAHLLSRSTGVNRIKGGSIQLN